jgi:hypothetical protein
VLGGAQTILALAGRGRTIAAEMLGMAGLACPAPLVVAVSGRPLDGRAAGGGILALLFFASSLAYVRAWRAREAGSRESWWRPCLAAHLGLAVLAAGIGLAGWVPARTLVALLPVAARTAAGFRWPPRDVRVLGGLEAGVALLFTLLAAAGYVGTAVIG